MKIRFFFLFLSCAYWSFGQEVKGQYFDDLNLPCDAASASYYQETTKTNRLTYQRIKYYWPSKKLLSTATYLDSNWGKYSGLALEYYESGKLKDSSFSNDTGKIMYGYTYYETGKLLQHVTYGIGNNFELHDYYENGVERVYSYLNDGMKEGAVIGYDENGQIVPNYIFQQEAEFEGGRQGWASYLQNKLRYNTPGDKKAPIGRYTVMVNFIVDKNGKVSAAKAENDPGYGTKEEALRVIYKSPRWKPAMLYNKPVKYRAKQSITFVVG